MRPAGPSLRLVLSDRVVAFAAVYIIRAAWFAHQKVEDATEINTLNQSDHRHVRNRLAEVWAAETAMQRYRAAPEAGNRAKTLSMLDSLVEDSWEFSRQHGIRNNPAMLQHAQKLAASSIRLRADVEHLMELRTDPDKIFPAVNIMRNEFHPATIEVITQTTLAMDESEKIPRTRPNRTRSTGSSPTAVTLVVGERQLSAVCREPLWQPHHALRFPADGRKVRACRGDRPMGYPSCDRHTRTSTRRHARAALFDQPVGPCYFVTAGDKRV